MTGLKGSGIPATDHLNSLQWIINVEEICWVADEFFRAACPFAVWGGYNAPLFLLKPETKKRNTTYSSSPTKDLSYLQRPPNLITYNLTVAIVSF